MSNRIVTRKRSLQDATSSSSNEFDEGVDTQYGRESKKTSYGCDIDDISNYVRAGKWTADEETLANQLVIDFENGALEDCDDGTTLRSYLARKLCCAPMRISKKFAGRCIGKLSFIRREGVPSLSKGHKILVTTHTRHPSSRRLSRNRSTKGQNKSRHHGMYVKLKSPTSSETSECNYQPSYASSTTSMDDVDSEEVYSDDGENSSDTEDASNGMKSNRSFVFSISGGISSTNLSSSNNLKSMGDFGHGNISSAFLDDYGFLDVSDEREAPECDTSLMLTNETVVGVSNDVENVPTDGTTTCDDETSTNSGVEEESNSRVGSSSSTQSFSLAVLIDGTGDEDYIWGDVITLLCDEDEQQQGLGGIHGSNSKKYPSSVSLAHMCN